jgi:hypothetical protein
MVPNPPCTKLVARANHRVDSMSETLQEMADRAKQHAIRYFREITDSCGDNTVMDESDWIVTSPPARRVFRLNKHFDFTSSYSWKILEAWKWYLRAIWYGEQGNVEGLVQSLLNAQAYEEEYHYGFEEDNLKMEKQYYRLQGANEGKLRKKKRRERLAKSLIVAGRADTLWDVAYLIERDKSEKYKHRAIYDSIKHLDIEELLQERKNFTSLEQ